MAVVSIEYGENRGALVHGESQELVSQGDGRENFGFDFARPTQPNTARAEHGRGQHRGSGKGATTFLEKNPQFRGTETATAVGFFLGKANPAQLCHFLPELSRESEIVVAVPELAQLGERGVCRDEFLRGLLQDLLFFREYEWHFFSCLNPGVRGRVWR